MNTCLPQLPGAELLPSTSKIMDGILPSSHAGFLQSSAEWSCSPLLCRCHPGTKEHPAGRDTWSLGCWGGLIWETVYPAAPGPGPAVPWVLLKPSSGMLRFTSTYFSHLLTGSCVRREDLVEVKKNFSWLYFSPLSFSP